MEIVYVTCGENGLYGLNYLISRGHKIRRVITVTQFVAGQHMISGYADITRDCAKQGTEIVRLDKYELRPEDLGGVDFDLLIVNGWNRLIKSEVIRCCKYGGLGIHAGHPPIGLGRAPLPWNIIKGFTDIEVYVFKLTERADDGDIVARRTIEITPMDDVRTLYEKVMFHGAILFEEALLAIAEGSAKPLPQNRQYMLHYQKRTPSDGLIDFCESVETIYNFIRAQTRPYPGAYAFLDGEKWYFWKAIPFDCHAFRDMERHPGQIIAALPLGIVIQTGTSALWLVSAEIENRTIIPRALAEMNQYVGRVFSGK